MMVCLLTGLDQFSEEMVVIAGESDHFTMAFGVKSRGFSFD
jgi:hypothetical protein